MAKLLDPLKSLITPEMAATAARKLGLTPEQVATGLELAMPLMATGMARATATPEGQVALMKAVNEADTEVLGNLSRFMGELTSDRGAASVSRLLGDDGRVIIAVIRERAGIDMTPILGMAGPIVLGFLNSQARQQGLDTNGLVKEIRGASRSYERAKDEHAAVVREAFKAADEVQQLRAQLSAEEWRLAQAGPMVAATQVVNSAPSRSKVVERELAAARRAVDEAVVSASPTSLIGALFASGAAGISIDGDTDASDALRRAMAAVGRVSAGEVASYRNLVMAAALAAAQAAKDGGFVGIGARAVNAAEQHSIDAIAAVIGLS